MHVLVVKNKRHKKLLEYAIKALLDYYEITGEVRGNVRKISDTLNKARGTIKRYLWELVNQGLVEYVDGEYVFSPERLREALERIDSVYIPYSKRIKQPLDENEVIKQINMLFTKITKIEDEVKKLKTQVEEIKTTIKDFSKEQARVDNNLLRELDEWSKDMDEWADKVDEKLDDLEERISNLTKLVLRLMDSSSSK